MPATIAVRPVHPDLPVEDAWQQGRRLYVRCAASSRLSRALHGRGAQWDPYARALWISTRHREHFTSWTLEHHRTRARLEQIRQAGLWVDIPYGADLVRARAKELGALFDGATKKWAMPSPAALVEVEELLQIWRRVRAQQRAEAERQRRAYWEERRRLAALEAAERRRALRERAARRQDAELEEAARREADRLRAARRDDTFRAELARTVGRTLLAAAPLEERREVFPRFTTGEAARAAAPHIGQVLRLEDGRRAMVWGRTVAFVPKAAAHAHGMSRAHWYAAYQLAVVAPTEQELDAEAARALEQWDAAELHALVVDAGVLSAPVPVDRPARVPDPVGAVVVTTGVNGLVPAGRLVLDARGVLWWQHPGEHTFAPVQGHVHDAGLVARMRAVLDAGPRRRTLARAGAEPLHYRVICGDRGDR